MKKFNTPNKLIAGGLLVVTGVTVAGCSSDTPDYSGRGNEFQVRGIVHDVAADGTIHINEKQIIIKSAVGKAATWFTNGDGQNALSDNFNFEPFYHQEQNDPAYECEHEVTVGASFGQYGQQIKPQQLKPGEVVEIYGSIRESNVSKDTRVNPAVPISSCDVEDYPVFKTATVVNGPLH